MKKTNEKAQAEKVQTVLTKTQTASVKKFSAEIGGHVANDQQIRGEHARKFKPELYAILDKHKENHVAAGLHIQEIAKESSAYSINTVKNWIGHWRKENNLEADPNKKNKGGQTNTAKAGAGQAMKSTEGEGFVCIDQAIEAGQAGFAPFLEKALSESGEFPECPNAAAAHVLKAVSKAALAFSRACTEQAKTREQMAKLDSDDLESINKDAKKATTKGASSRSGNRKSKKVTAQN